MLVDHAFIFKYLKPPVARKLAVGPTSVWQLVFWLLGVSTNYFTKFHDFSKIIQFFSNSMHGTFVQWFSMISRACGNPVKGSERRKNIILLVYIREKQLLVKNKLAIIQFVLTRGSWVAHLRRYMGHVVTKPVFGVSEKVRLKPVSSATETR